MQIKNIIENQTRKLDETLATIESIQFQLNELKQSLRVEQQLAKEKNVQLFISTHSLEIIDTILELEDNPNNITLFNLDNATDNIRCSGDLLKRLRFDRGLDVR